MVSTCWTQSSSMLWAEAPQLAFTRSTPGLIRIGKARSMASTTPHSPKAGMTRFPTRPSCACPCHCWYFSKIARSCEHHL